MPEELGIFEMGVKALERIAGDPDVLTGLEELSTAFAGSAMEAPVGPAIEKLAEAGNNIARAIDRLAAVIDGAPAGPPAHGPEPEEIVQPGPDPACVGPVTYEGLGRKELRAMCERRKIHTNSKMSIAKLTGMLDNTPAVG